MDPEFIDTFRPIYRRTIAKIAASKTINSDTDNSSDGLIQLFLPFKIRAFAICDFEILNFYFPNRIVAETLHIWQDLCPEGFHTYCVFTHIVLFKDDSWYHRFSKHMKIIVFSTTRYVMTSTINDLVTGFDYILYPDFLEPTLGSECGIFSRYPHKNILPFVQQKLKGIYTNEVVSPEKLDSLKKRLTTYRDRSKNELRTDNAKAVKKTIEQIDLLYPQAPQQEKKPSNPSEKKSNNGITQLSNEMTQLSIKNTQHLPPNDFPFKKGDRVDPKLHFDTRVSRWYKAPLKEPLPFQTDPIYQAKKLSPEEEQTILLRHTIPLALVDVIIQYGERYQPINDERESFILFADIQMIEGTEYTQGGVVTIGRNSSTKLIYHYHFSLPGDVRTFYLNNGFIESPQTQNQKKSNGPIEKDLQIRDGSTISEITVDTNETRVTAISRYHNVKMTVHIPRK